MVVNPKILIFLKGFLMGICDLIPGISGGTIAFITGIYEKLINSVKNFNIKLIKNLIIFNKQELKKDLERINPGFLIILILGIATAVVIGSNIIKYLLEQYPNLRVIGVEPEGSILRGTAHKPDLIQGSGLSFMPKNLDRDVIKEIEGVKAEDAFHAARELGRKESIVSGSSAGSVVYILKKVVKEIGSDKNVVAILADDGFRYGNNFYDDNWLMYHSIQPK